MAVSSPATSFVSNGSELDGVAVVRLGVLVITLKFSAVQDSGLGEGSGGSGAS